MSAGEPLAAHQKEHFCFVSDGTCGLLFQIIQRQLEQVEEKQRQLEERGVAVEKALRGEAGNFSSSPPLLSFLFILNYVKRLQVETLGFSFRTSKPRNP